MLRWGDGFEVVVVVVVVVVGWWWVVEEEEDMAVVVAWFMVNVGWGLVVVVASMADLCWLLVWSWVCTVGEGGGTSLLASVVGAASELD